MCHIGRLPLPLPLVLSALASNWLKWEENFCVGLVTVLVTVVLRDAILAVVTSGPVKLLIWKCCHLTLLWLFSHWGLLYQFQNVCVNSTYFCLICRHPIPPRIVRWRQCIASFWFRCWRHCSTDHRRRLYTIRDRSWHHCSWAYFIGLFLLLKILPSSSSWWSICVSR